jgi:DNA-binding response OmpR family regulator
MNDPLRVLIVEDEALLLMQLEATIEEEGHDVVGTAMSSGEAIALARLVEPDIAFVDLHLLDGPTGIYVARHLRASDKTLVVFITANATRVPEDYEGAAGIVAKPFSQAGITACIRYLSECIRRPPPGSPIPAELRVAPRYYEQVTGHASEAPQAH